MYHSLSSLNFLSPEGTVRPKSKQTPRGNVPPEEGKDDNVVAFRDFPDYSKMNADRHNASRSDTFKTATSPARKKLHGNSITSDEASSLNSSHLISGIRHEVREIGKDIKGEIQEEIQQTLLLMRKDVQSTLDIITDTRDSTVGVLMGKLKEDIHAILADAGWPLKVDFTPLQDEFVQGELARNKGYRDMMQQMEDRLGQKIGPLVDELPVLRRLHEDLQTEFEHANKRMIDDSLAVQRTLVTDLTKTMQHVQHSQQAFFDDNANLKERLSSEIKKHVQEEPVNVNFSEVMHHLGGIQVDCSLMTLVHKEVNSLCKDLEHVRNDVSHMYHMKKMKDHSRKAPREEMWTQTEGVETSHGFCQTDDKFWRAKVPTKSKSQTNSKAKHAYAHGIASTVDLSKTHESKKAKGNAVFADAEAMRKRARQALIKPQYNVFDYYHSRGLAQRLAKHQVFENTTFFMVTFNALWISIDADYNDASLLIDAHPVFQFAENLFCLYFFSELSTRFLAFKEKRRCLRDGWFVFDLMLVTLMVLETWAMSAVILIMGNGSNADIIDPSMLRLVRIVKILRLSRLARLMRAVPEIIVFVKGIGAASRSVISLFGLWSIIIYIFAVFFVQTATGDMKQGDFRTVPMAMNTLLLDGILSDQSGMVMMVSDSNYFFWPVMIGFVLLASITLSYMLIGVLVQIIQAIAVAEKERAIVGVVAHHLRSEWTDHGYDSDVNLSKVEFQQLLVEPSIAVFLQEVGVDVLVLVDMSDMIYDDIAKEARGLGFEAFVEAVLNMRGTNPVTVQDVKSQLRIMKRMIKENVVGLEETIATHFDKSSKQVKRLRKVVCGEDDDDESSEDGSDAESDGFKDAGAGAPAYTSDGSAARSIAEIKGERSTSRTKHMSGGAMTLAVPDQE